MAQSSRARFDLPLWWLPLLCALLPFVAAHGALWLSVQGGLVPACNPYFDGCVSISRAARHGWGNHLFQLLMLPAASLQVLCWLAATLWLRQMGQRVRALPWLGLVAGAFLALYATFLGSQGDVYELLRRYGIYLYFGCTYLALLLTLRTLSRGPAGATYRWLLLVALGFMAEALASIAVSYAVADEVLNDRWENLLEWQVGLWLTAMFAVLAWCWRREGLRVSLD